MGTETVTETVMDTGTARKGRRGQNGDGGRRNGKQARTGRAAGSGVKKESVGRGCVRVLGGLQGGQCRLDSAPIISVTIVTRDWSCR